MSPLLMRVGLYLAVLAALFFGGYRAGYKKAEEIEQRAKVVALQDAAERYQAEVEKNANLGARLTEQLTAQETKYRTITKEVTHVIEKPVYRSCSLDDDGVRLWDNANRNTAESANPAEPNAGVPAVTAP